MSEPNAASPLDAKFARKVRVSRWALLFERLWPRVWLILGLVGLFLLVSLAGLWPMLSDPAHYVAVAAFAVAGVAALLHAVRVPFPSHEEAVRRIERVSGVPHRPASSYEDTILPKFLSLIDLARDWPRRFPVSGWGRRARAPIGRIPSPCVACSCSASSRCWPWLATAFPIACAPPSASIRRSPSPKRGSMLG